MANRDPKKPKPKLPEVRIPRPGSEAGHDRPRPATGAELASFLGKKGRGVVRFTAKGGPDG